VLLGTPCIDSELNNIMALLIGDQDGLIQVEGFRGGQFVIEHVNSCHGEDKFAWLLINVQLFNSQYDYP